MNFRVVYMQQGMQHQHDPVHCWVCLDAKEVHWTVAGRAAASTRVLLEQ